MTQREVRPPAGKMLVRRAIQPRENNMASLMKKSGRWLIQFIGPDKRRRTLRLGDVPKDDAETAHRHVEAIVKSMHADNLPPADTARWLGKISAQWHERFIRVGLASPRQSELKKREEEDRKKLTLGAFLDEYIAGRTDLKRITVSRLKDSRRYLVEYFEAHAPRPLASITTSDAKAWRRWMATKLGDNTVRRQCGRAKQFFQAAVESRLIADADNPFRKMKDCAVQANGEREFFITRENATKVLGACPDAEWRLIFALSRYGGLRCPSEHLALTWGDVNWELGRMLVRSPKTERHVGHSERWVPIFPELRLCLQAALDELLEGFDPQERRLSQQHVITRYRDSNVNLRTQLLRIIHKAGLTPWPKLFQNLRASRATELAADYPAHVAAKWLGHSTAIAQKHYWQVTDADFAKAIQPTQKAQHNTPEIDGNAAQGESSDDADFQAFPGISPDCNILQSCSVPPAGREHPCDLQGETAKSQSGAAQSAARPDVLTVLAALAKLTPDERAAILAALGERV